MPVMTGVEASVEILRQMREAMGPGQEELTHIVALTSFTTNSIQQKCIEVGMKTVYFKPLKFEVLAVIMQQNFTRTKQQ